MREQRSGSQILFGYIPEQTVDLGGRVWKVRKWSQPLPVAVDDESIREELIRQATAWERTGNGHLRQRYDDDRGRGGGWEEV